MKKKLVIISAAIFLCISALAEDGEYAVSKISPALLKNAHAVLRLETLSLEIIGHTKTTYKNHYVITILNENGEQWSPFYEYYDKHRKIESAEGFLYDVNGKLLKKVKLKDMEDVSGVSESSLIDDDRVKRHSFYHKVYPYTIEYNVEISNSSTLFFPYWVPQGRAGISVEQSSMKIICNEDYQFRYKAFNYSSAPIVTIEKNKKITSWSVKILPSISKELYGPLWHELTTMVIFGPTEFQIDEYQGNMLTWQDFGKFIHSLKQGRDVLPDNVKQKVHALTDGISDVKTKIALLYAYLQKNTRYISIQLGIGGWQPFEAKFVATKAYGDCKALTNYMYSLLKEAGIKSFYALIRAGANAGYITADFPSQQFNHVILSVPLANDTVWLECTSQTLPMGYLSDFTCDRFALLVDEDGGKLVRTPKYGLNENTAIRKVYARLNSEGTLKVNSITNYTGLQQDDLHGMINNLSKEKVKEYLERDLDFATYDIDRFEYKENKSVLPVINEALDITVSNYATISGRRLFIVPNVMTRSHRKPVKDDQRKYDVILNYEFRDIDSVEIEIPEGYTVESLPANVTVTSQFGKYSITSKLNGNKITCFRIAEQYSGRFPAASYNEMVKYYEDVYKADRAKMVLVKNEATKGF